jgi:hypothetical protein
MITCANCRHSNLAGAVFCTECGTALNPGPSVSTDDAPPWTGSAPAQAAATVPPPILLDNWVTLHLLDTGHMLPLTERNEFTLGRISEGQPIMPDIDLSPYQAYAHGVSRLHAVIKRGTDSIVLMDLGSANGTYVNGKRLPPNLERDLANGDVVAMGRLKIQILLKAS